MSLTYTDQTVDALTQGQANRTDPVLAANPSRSALVIMTGSPAWLVLKPGLDWNTGPKHGIPLAPNVPLRLTGNDCPSNALYVVGLSYGATLMIWEA